MQFVEQGGGMRIVQALSVRRHTLGVAWVPSEVVIRLIPMVLTLWKAVRPMVA